MSIYVITGGTTGIGAEARKKLQDEGHEVFNIDYNGGDYTADLSTDEGRKGAVKAVFLKYPDGIDGVLCNAGVGPTAPPKKIFALNFFAAIAIAEGLRPLLKKKGGNCVVTSSNSITNATVKRDWVDMLSNVADENATMEFAGHIPPDKTPSCYSSSKHALARWVRRVSSSWAADGLRINADMQVLDTNAEVIPGLYAAGNCGGSVFADGYYNLTHGMACGRALTFARHAVNHIAGTKA